MQDRLLVFVQFTTAALQIGARLLYQSPQFLQIGSVAPYDQILQHVVGVRGLVDGLEVGVLDLARMLQAVGLGGKACACEKSALAFLGDAERLLRL
jgi:hypothetical protein